MTHRARKPGSIRRLAGGGTLALLIGASAAAANEGEARPGLSVSVRAARSACFSDRVEVTGVLAPRQEVDVGVEREGLRVTQVLAQPLDSVTAGQVLADLGPIEGASGGPASLKSSVAGTVLRSNARTGSPASPRQDPLFQIMPRGEIDLKADVALSDLPKLAAGQAVSVKPLGLAEVAGTIRQVEVGLDPASQLGRARIGLSAVGGDLRVGTFARGTIVLAERCGIGVPYSSIQYEADGTIVHIVEEDRVVARPVVTGLLSGSDIEIRSGLTEADTVVVRAGAFLRDGDRVNPILLRETPGEGR